MLCVIYFAFDRVILSSEWSPNNHLVRKILTVNCYHHKELHLYKTIVGFMLHNMHGIKRINQKNNYLSNDLKNIELFHDVISQKTRPNANCI